MSGANNATIALPGSGWRLLWPTDFNDFQLDIVGFLAVLGEGSIQTVAQVSALSRLFYLPRLLPAPQALLRTTRPNKLEPTDAAVSAIRTGNFKDHLHHVAHVLLEDEMPAFHVRCVKIVKREDKSRKGKASWTDTILRGVSRENTGGNTNKVSPPVKAKANGPLLWVTVLDFVLSLALFIISMTLGDSMSLIATILLSILSTLIGVGNKWTLKLAQRPDPKKEKFRTSCPQDTMNGKFEEEEHERDGVVIRYPNGSYMVVRCNEDVARELYFAPEEIEYTLKSATKYRLISLVGTLLLMLGVIFLANAKLQLQICWGGAYIILNAAHWLAAAVPARMHWDLECYSVQEQGITGGPKSDNFTEAAWKAIFFARSIAWVRLGKNAVPNTEIWNTWLHKTEKLARDPHSEYKTLESPLKHLKQTKGRVWIPPADFNAKELWDQIYEESKESEKEQDLENGLLAQATPGAVHVSSTF